jgi:hypothetical protein
MSPSRSSKKAAKRPSARKGSAKKRARGAAKRVRARARTGAPTTVTTPCNCCCCVTSAIIENVHAFGAGGYIDPTPPPITVYNGHIFDFRIEMMFAAGTSGTSDCVLEWWEKVNIPALTGHAPNTWTNMYSSYSGSPTLQPWVNRTVRCPAGGSTTVVIHDPPSLGIAPGITQTRTLRFRLVVKSGAGCSCGNTRVTARATQVLEMINGTLSPPPATRFTIGRSSVRHR